MNPHSLLHCGARGKLTARRRSSPLCSKVALAGCTAIVDGRRALTTVPQAALYRSATYVAPQETTEAKY